MMSPASKFNDKYRAILLKTGETSSVLVNEEDHFRIQSMTSGFDPLNAWEQVDGLDDRLSQVIPFSFSRHYGYLTACPTNIGTGLRISILIHLPALVLTKEIQRMVRSAQQIGLTIRGYYGEGTDVVGNLFQISNYITLGKPEHEIVDELATAAKKIIEYERKAAETLMLEARNQIEDKIFRSMGILKSARVLSTNEFMNLSSAVRMGVMLGIVSKPELKTLNELLVISQPGHIQARHGKSLEEVERDKIRADIVRERFIDARL
jgi:protein arginine kinase